RRPLREVVLRASFGRPAASRKGGKFMARTKSLRVLLAGEGGEFEHALRAAGHDVDVGDDAVAALNVAGSYSLDVVVIDLDEFQGEPFALAKAIRVATFGYKPLFVAMTASQTGQVEDKCRDAGIDLLLLKPVALALLTGFLRR